MLSKIYKKLYFYIKSGLFTIFFMGFASGFPFALTASVLSLRLKEAGISISSIGIFTLVAIPYSFKYLWAPLLDSLNLPLLQKKLGKRRGWLLITQIFIVVALMFFGTIEPQKHIYLCAMLALLITFLSATQDIIIDAYRIERLPLKLQGIGAALTTYGYRVGLFVSGVVPLLIAEIISWSAAYYSAAIIMFIAIFTTLICEEPNMTKITKSKLSNDAITFLIKTFILPFKDLLKIHNIGYILAFIILFKLGDAMAGVMTMPFLSDKNFTKTEIVTIVKTFGTAATFIGLFLGGLLVYKIPLKRALLIAGICQMLSNILFIYQDYVGHNNIVLAITIIGENLASGIGGTTLVAYLSSLCNIKFAATHYALLSSIATLSRNILSSLSGFIVDYSSWSVFFLISIIAAIPALLLLPKLTFFKKIE